MNAPSTDTWESPALQPSPGAKTYQRFKLRLSLLSIILDLVVVAFLLFSGLTIHLRNLVMQWTDNAWLVVLYFFLILGLAMQLLSLPLDYYRGFHVEKRFGMSNQTRRGWLWDWIKSFLISGLLGLGAVELIYFLLRTTGQNWWWIAALMVMGVLVILAKLVPIILIPLFYRIKPLEREELKARLLALAERCGTSVMDVFEMQLSAKTRAANAALAGWGSTRRILLGDTLLHDYSDDEIESVLAHELAHHHYGHIWKGMVAQAGSMLMGFYLADKLLLWGVNVRGYNSIADVAAFPLLALSFVLIALVLLPLMNGLSRHFERQADRFAVQLTRQPQSLASAFRKMAVQNLSDPSPHPIVEFVFYSHPSINRRIAALQAQTD